MRRADRFELAALRQHALAGLVSDSDEAGLIAKLGEVWIVGEELVNEVAVIPGPFEMAHDSFNVPFDGSDAGQHVVGAEGGPATQRHGMLERLLGVCPRRCRVVGPEFDAQLLFGERESE